jgi:hypothetical protein
MTDVMQHNGDSILIEDFDWDDPANVDYTLPGYDEWKQKRQSDTRYCMHQRRRENPKNGRSILFHQPCGEPDCPNCGPRIREEMHQALSKHLEEMPLRRLTLTSGNLKGLKEQRAKILRKYGKDNVSVFANDILTDKGLDTELEILIKTEDDIGEAYTQVEWEDIERWSLKSFNTKKSGKLHKLTGSASVAPADPPDITDCEKIALQEWIFDTYDDRKLKEIELEVLEETSDLNPQTFNELEVALEVRRAAWKRKLAEKEIVILGNELYYMYIKESDIDWSLPKGKLKTS